MYWWYHNHTRATSSASGSKKILNLTKGKQKLAAYQAYYKLKKEELRPIINEKYAAHLLTLPAGTTPPNKWVWGNALVRKLLEEEDDDTKAAVEKFRNESVAQAVDFEEPENDAEGEEERQVREARMEEIAQ